MNGSASPISLISSSSGLSGGGSFINPEMIVESLGLRPGMKIADFGSGSGYFTLLMAKKAMPGGTVTALDILENTLEVIRAKAAAGGLNNIQTVRANLEVAGSSGLPDNSQDLVLLANILFQSDKKTEILKEAQRILASGGKLVVVEWRKDSQDLGPAAASRLDSGEIKMLTQTLGLKFIQEINAGAFHFGLIFGKD